MKREVEGMLVELAKKIGVKVVPLKKRGEVKIILGEFELRLSQNKALALLLWIYNIKNKEEV